MDCSHEFTMCRLCLCESESFIDIFQMNEWFGYVTAEVIRDLLQFQVSERDGYPHVVCSICLEKLTDFKQFKEKCRNSRDTYDNVFASDEIYAEHPIDIEEHGPVKLEPKDPLDTQEGQEEEPPASIKTEVEERRNDVDAITEIRKCSFVSTSPDRLACLRKRTRRESYGPRESSVNDVGKPSLKIRRKVAVDANPGEDDNLSDSANVKVGKMDIKVGNDCKSPVERIHIIPVEKSDANRVESRREEVKRLEDVNCVDASVDAIVENGETFTLKLERDGKREGGSEREGGEEDPLGVDERGGEEERFRCNRRGKGLDLGVHDYEANGESSSGEREIRASVNCGSKRKKNGVRKKGSKGKKSGKAKRDEGGVGKYVCDSCGKAFNRIGKLKAHVRVHSGERPFVCGICGKTFNDKSNLKRHRFTHTGEKPHLCRICCKRFALNSILKSHMQTHSGEKPHVCEICGQKFTQIGSLRSHARIHSGEKPYGCHVCSKCFRFSGGLRRHLRIHSR